MNKPFVFLDAGHGINTAGKRSPIFNNNKDYMAEFEFNIAVTFILYKLLRDNNIKVEFSTDNIFDTDLNIRIGYINMQNRIYSPTYTPILISIHANAFGDGKTFNTATGIETLYNPNKPYDEKLATFIHTEVTNSLFQMQNRGLKSRSGLALLKKVNMPACMVECGFMTNKDDLTKLLSYEYKLDLAHAIYNGIIKYYE